MSAPVRLPPEIQPVLENGIPADVVTCSLSGQPNATVISQVYYVDATHIALSFQFFNKTSRNVRENPTAAVLLNDLEGAVAWILGARYDHSETDGAIFEAMDVQIEAIASATGMAGIFKLRAADVYEVLSVKRIDLASR